MFEKCECQPKYTIEPHGDAYALFFGRCNHRHGYNFMRISDIAHNAPDFKVIEDALNAASNTAVTQN